MRDASIQRRFPWAKFVVAPDTIVPHRVPFPLARRFQQICTAYLAEVYAAVRGGGGVCIADEIQTGYGRIGTGFYAFESQGVTPDIVALGKPIGNGHPIGAVITTPEIAASFANGMEFSAPSAETPCPAPLDWRRST